MDPILGILVAATILIGLLCWIWMKSSRASQVRMEAMNEKVIVLLEEQNALLRRIAEK
ncbi:MAG: hypothetical protein HYU52_01085 [Acidobacteria bacterium]|nr:hypothetical protein [Acidobacteriota bacterium]